ncbi:MULTISPECIES: carbohydrate-binding protein [Streptomyces]|uniref:Dimeric protein n=1 Tax=Streptomyces albus (strain ATCC 21838 / DSM 41398 / FERM P-419 / JCM 4703 / NBRC 107858) TaxID=1081613 RepID=A0A0B5F105_STRA4|nr:carbohydrate-binding protein [Streptomyces sp. SCSIO ZS0520]AJE84566.1 dimeric protein [Streptomyces albus]AOU78876.1 dimeric protein [Streptomyces albus]
MTPGNDGASTPEDDDPFGYLYADGQASGATPPSGGYGYPGPRSYHNVRAVGERQYGQGASQGTYGQGQQYAGGQQYGQQQYGQGQQQGPGARQYGQQAPQQQYQGPNPHYSAPETLPGGGGAPPARHEHHDGGGRGRGPNTRGLLIGAVAVVAAVVIGIGIAVLGGSGDDKASDKPGDDSTAGQTQDPTEEPTGKPDKPLDLPKADAKALTLTGGTKTDSTIEGARAQGGVYVAGLNTPGARVAWKVDGIPEEGDYTLFVGYGVPGKAAETTLTVNGKPSDRKLNMDNFAGAKEGAWDKGWTQTFAWIHLSKGTNTFVISCETGDTCDANLDQVWLKAGHVKK